MILKQVIICIFLIHVSLAFTNETKNNLDFYKRSLLEARGKIPEWCFLPWPIVWVICAIHLNKDKPFELNSSRSTNYLEIDKKYNLDPVFKSKTHPKSRNTLTKVTKNSYKYCLRDSDCGPNPIMGCIFLNKNRPMR